MPLQTIDKNLNPVVPIRKNYVKTINVSPTKYQFSRHTCKIRVLQRIYRHNIDRSIFLSDLYSKECTYARQHKSLNLSNSSTRNRQKPIIHVATTAPSNISKDKLLHRAHIEQQIETGKLQFLIIEHIFQRVL